MKSIAAVVVLFNTQEEIINNINSYLNHVEKIYAVDNSDSIVNLEIVNKLYSITKVDYITFQENKGIAAALNFAANKAIEEGFDYLLTMDQDSRASENMIQTLYSMIKKDDQIGLIAANHFNPEIQKEPKTGLTSEVLYTMTSGNLISLSAFQKVGGFDEKLFIDHVDHEYCLRLKVNGFKIVKTNNALVYHRLGKSEIKKILCFNLYPTHHPPVRIYYRTRNRLYINNKYKEVFPEYIAEDRKHFFHELIFMVLGEHEVLKKIKMILRGYIDYKKNKFGKFG